VVRKEKSLRKKTDVTSQQLGDVARGFLEKLQDKMQAKPSEAFALWPQIVGPAFAGMTRAVKLDAKKLYVVVSNSSALSLLHHSPEKKKWIAMLQMQGVEIIDIVFRMG